MVSFMFLLFPFDIAINALCKSIVNDSVNIMTCFVSSWNQSQKWYQVFSSIIIGK